MLFRSDTFMQAFVVFFVSPEIRRFKSLMKTGKAQRICQPHYERDEMLDVAPFAMPHETDVQRELKVDLVISRFGGNVRALFSDEDFWSYWCDVQDTKIKSLVAQGLVQTLEDTEKLPELSHTMIKLQPLDSGSYVIRLLSEYVQVKVVAQLNRKQLFDLKYLLQFTSKQNEFELFCQNVVSRGGTFQSRSLHSTEENMELPKIDDAKMFYSLHVCVLYACVRVCACVAYMCERMHVCWMCGYE